MADSIEAAAAKCPWTMRYGVHRTHFTHCAMEFNGFVRIRHAGQIVQSIISLNIHEGDRALAGPINRSKLSFIAFQLT